MVDDANLIIQFPRPERGLDAVENSSRTKPGNDKSSLTKSSKVRFEIAYVNMTLLRYDYRYLAGTRGAEGL